MAAAYNEKTNAPIVAFDFDGVVATDTEGSIFPIVLDECEDKSIHRLMDFMRSLGVVVGIWTCREQYHRTCMEQFLVKHKYQVDFINDTSMFAPYEYIPRKVYAHLYIDDRAYGWSNAVAAVDILEYFLERTCSGSNFTKVEVRDIIRKFINSEQPEEWMIERIKCWRD